MFTCQFLKVCKVHVEVYRHGAGVNTHTHTHRQCVHTGVAGCVYGHPYTGQYWGTAHSGGLVGSFFSNPGHALCPDPVPGGQRQPPCPTTKLEWKVHSKDPSRGIGREQHHRARAAAQGKVGTSWAPPTPRICLCLGRGAHPHLPWR